MSHVAEGVFQALLDGELPPGERAAVERHLEACPACRGEVYLLRTASADLSGALLALDRTPPVERALREASRRRRWRGWSEETRRALPRAALLLLGVGVVASATVPGSPLREWIGALAAPEAPVVEGPAAPPADDPPAPVAVPSAAVSVRPEAGWVRVVLTAPAPGVRIRVRLSDEPFSDVRGLGAAAEARFRTSPGRIEVSGATAGEVEIAIPRSARAAVVEVDGRPYLRKDGDGLRLLAPAADSSGSEVLFTVEP